MMPHTKGSRSCAFRKEDFFMSSLYAYVKHVTPGRTHFWPKGHNLNKLGRGLPDDATYQMPYGFKLDFLIFNSKIYFLPV